MNLFDCCLLYNSEPLHPDRIYTDVYNYANGSSSIMLIFTWESSNITVCPNVHYNIIASHCGKCPKTTIHTSAECTDQTVDGRTCTLSVQPVVCGYVYGEKSIPAVVLLAGIYSDLILMLIDVIDFFFSGCYSSQCSTFFYEPSEH